MGKDQREIKRDIEDLRSRLGDIDSIKKAATNIAARVSDTIKKNPVSVAVGSVAAGFLLGSLLRSTVARM